MLENIVYIELLARGYEVFVGKFDSNEIDFVASLHGEKIYIQVTYQINNADTEKREYQNLLKIKDNYPKYVLRMDNFATGNYEGIKTMHVADLDDKF